MGGVAAAASALAASLLVVSGCAVDRVADDSQDVEFTPCTRVECSGELPSGAAFEIMMPETWNGTLAIYSRGTSVGSESGAPDVAAAVHGRSSGRTVRQMGPAPAPRWGQGDKTIADVMLQSGYAIAGAAPGSEGWRVAAQVQAGEELYEYFSRVVAVPNRVYVWGMSEGGLASIQLAESHPDWISGGVALCAPTAGVRPTFNLALDGAFAVKQLLYPRMKLTGYSSPDEAVAARDAALAKIRSASSTRGGRAKILFIGALAGLPPQSSTEPGDSRSSRVAAYSEGIEHLIGLSTVWRHDLEQQVGGNPSSNVGTDYRTRFTAAEQGDIEDERRGATAALYERLDAGRRVEADPGTDSAAADLGEPSGGLAAPFIAVHNGADPIYVAQNATWYADRTAANSVESRANLVGLFLIPPTDQSPAAPAEEGAGHCVFKSHTITGTLILLNDWVRNGHRPEQVAIERALPGADFAVDADVGPWPPMGILAPASRSGP